MKNKRNIKSRIQCNNLCSEGEKISQEHNKNIAKVAFPLWNQRHVYPMSEEALIKTIYMEVDTIEDSQGKDNIILVPEIMEKNWFETLDLQGIVKISNL